jgi:small conductance mechanosensitive channel
MPIPTALDPSAPPVAAHPGMATFQAIDADADAALSGRPDAWRKLADSAGDLVVHLVVAIVILIVTLLVSAWLAKLVRRALSRLPHGPDETLRGFLSSLARWIVIVVGLTVVLEQLGVRATSILAMLAAASLAIGLALQGALGNVAAGVMLLILRPYKVGDVVEIDGKIGTVKHLDLFMTELADPDNLDLYLPNAKVFGTMIVNYSSPSNRRMELHFEIDYDDDLDRALALLIDCAKADKRILAHPAPWSAVTALTPNTVQVTLRAWAKLDVFWDARFDMIKRVKETIEAAGLSFPYPHQVALAKKPKAGTVPGAKVARPTTHPRRRGAVPSSDVPSQS